jgi:hypothetical protein
MKIKYLLLVVPTGLPVALAPTKPTAPAIAGGNGASGRRLQRWLHKLSDYILLDKTDQVI